MSRIRFNSFELLVLLARRNAELDAMRFKPSAHRSLQFRKRRLIVHERCKVLIFRLRKAVLQLELELQELRRERRERLLIDK